MAFYTLFSLATLSGMVSFFALQFLFFFFPCIFLDLDDLIDWTSLWHSTRVLFNGSGRTDSGYGTLQICFTCCYGRLSPIFYTQKKKVSIFGCMAMDDVFMFQPYLGAFQKRSAATALPAASPANYIRLTGPFTPTRSKTPAERGPGMCHVLHAAKDQHHDSLSGCMSLTKPTSQ
ncbi:hypothetical protein VTO42DRAFT_5880 [Malbranchea cinnamomea]